MRAHDILEGMRLVEAGKRPFVEHGIDADLWAEMKGAAAQAVNVDKGSIVLPPQVIQFGRDLFSNGILQLPFEVTFFVPPTNQHAGALAIMNGLALNIATVEPLRVSATRQTTAILPALLINVEWDENADRPRIHTGYVLPRLKELRGGQETDRVFQVIDFVLGTTALLGMKEAAIKEKAAPSILNRERLRKGKPTISKTVVVNLATTQAGQTGGTHASPAPHWRRGHLRRLANGQVIKVSPTIVGWKQDSDIAIKKDYILKGFSRPAASSNPAPLPPASELPVSDDGKPHR